jgi:L-threonylcarbamoyladenylate synthase
MFSDTFKDLVKPGAVGVIPTDTVYGLVARASDEAAVGRLYSLKDRERKPGTVIAASINQLEELGLKRRYLTAVEQFWPGAISVIVPTSNPKLNYLHQGQYSLAVRIPNQADLTELLIKTGPLVTSSANAPGQPTSVNLDEAKSYFGEKVDFYVDGGNLSGNLPSTIVRVIDDAVEVIRQGAVKIDHNDKI